MVEGALEQEPTPVGTSVPEAAPGSQPAKPPEAMPAAAPAEGSVPRPEEAAAEALPVPWMPVDENVQSPVQQPSMMEAI
eukprot:229660-Lingulodinium_polyedra.AAC.1